MNLKEIFDFHFKDALVKSMAQRNEETIEFIKKNCSNKNESDNVIIWLDDKGNWRYAIEGIHSITNISNVIGHAFIDVPM